MQKKKAKPFQMIMTAIFVVLIIVAVVVFSRDREKPTDDGSGGINYGSVVVWGTVPSGAQMTGLFDEFNRANRGTVSASYVYVAPDALESRLLEALSNDKGPDAVILPHEWLNRNILRITPTSYDITKQGMDVRQFKNTFTQAGEIFLYPEGIVAMPLAIDPLVMYWNRDLFTNAEIVSPPTSWKQILALTPKLTKKKNLDILQSTIALGEYENVNRAKDILSLMFLQVGSPITKLDGSGVLRSSLSENPAVLQAIRYYVDFANPLKSSYSWNRSLPSAQDAFLANELAMYIDFASAYPTLVAKNPRLNFDIAPVPQTDGQVTAVTYGRIHAITVLKRGKNPAGGLAFAKRFSGKTSADQFAKAAGMAPMRRDLLAIPQTDAYQSTLYSTALRARSWLDPQPVETNTIFSRMIESIISGKTTADLSLVQANTEMTSLLDSKR